MTSDTRRKEFAIEIDGIRIGDRPRRMIRQDMATMPAFLTTDAAIERERSRPRPWPP